MLAGACTSLAIDLVLAKMVYKWNGVMVGMGKWPCGVMAPSDA